MNAALDEGWELLAIREKTEVSQARGGRVLSATALVYVLGWPRAYRQSELASGSGGGRGLTAAPVVSGQTGPTPDRLVHEITPRSPVPANNGPVGWLKRKLIPSVLRKHTDARIELVEAQGVVQRVRISAPESELAEIVNDVTSSIEWAFETVLSNEAGRREVGGVSTTDENMLSREADS